MPFSSVLLCLVAAVVQVCPALGDGEALVLDVPEGSTQTESESIAAASLNKTGAGELVLDGPSIVVSGRATSSAGKLTVTGAGTRSFGSLMAAEGILEFDNAGTVTAGAGFIRSSSLCATMSLVGTNALNGTGTWQIAAGAGQRGCLRIGDGSAFALSGEFQMGQSGCAHLELDGGSLAASSTMRLSQGGGTASIVANGGSFTTSGAIEVGASNAAAGGETLVAAYGAGGVVKTSGDFAVKAAAAHRTVVAACDGGVFGAAHVTKAASDVSKLHLGFNGGVLAPTYPYNFFNDLEPDSLTVYENGMTIDTSETKNNGAFGAVWLTKPIAGPTGQSVAAIGLPSDVAFPSECYSGPVPVTIAGAGVGAAAVAEYDPVTRQIASIRIVSPGTGYDENTTATIPSEDGARTYSCPVTMVAARNTGSLRKRGGAVYRLYGGNTYGGDTVAEGGELVLWADDSLPATSGIICRDGATFNLNNKNGGAFTVPRLGGVGGVISGGSVTVTESLVFDGADIAAATQPLQMTGSLTLGANVRLQVDNAKGLEAGVRREVLHADGGISGAVGNDGRFKVEISNGSVFLTKRIGPGLILTFR